MILLSWVHWDNEINFVMNHAPGAGLTTRSINQLSTIPATWFISQTPLS